MDLDLLHDTLAADGEPAFRAGQVWRWLARGAGEHAQMTDLPAGLRERLAAQLPISTLAVRREDRSRDGTVKALFHTHDGRPLEAVMMRYRDGRGSLCLSSQSGCPLTCTFCATGAMRFARNLTASEILDQALHFQRLLNGLGDRDLGDGGSRRAVLTNCVFMGMGEPMLNLEAVLAACERLPDLGISHRHTTISTVGWIPGIEALAAQPMPVRLALSLHAAQDDLRTQLMPINERYPLRDVLDACDVFYRRRKRRIFIEHVMLAGVNDRYEQALALANLLNAHRGDRGQTIFKVNLIPYNPTDTAARYDGSSREAIAAFKAVLAERGVPVTVRLTRGRDIAAACGQLAAKAAA